MPESKKVGKNVAVVFAFFVALVAGLAGLTVGGYAGYTKGYKQGEFAGRYEASRSASAATVEMMARGFDVKNSDGSVKNYVLEPVESKKN